MERGGDLGGGRGRKKTGLDEMKERVGGENRG